MSKSFVVGNAGTASSGTFVGSYSGQQYVYSTFGTYPTGNPNLAGTAAVFIDSVALQGAISAAHGYSVQYRSDSGGTLFVFYNTDGGTGQLNFTRYLNNGGSVGSSTGDTWSGGGLWATVNWSTYPGAPTTIAASRTGTSVKITIGGASDDGGTTLTSYTAQYSSNGGSTYPVGATMSGGITTFTGLTPGTTYTFRAFGNNAHGAGAARTISASIPPVPTAPTLSCTVNARDVTLNLGTSTSTDPVTYYAQISSDSGVTWSASQVVTGGTYTYTGLTPGGTYRFRAFAASDVGDSPVTTVTGVTIATVPSAPASITPVRSGRNVTVTVGASASTGGDPILGYFVQSSHDGGTTWTSPVQTSGSGGGSYTYTGLSTGQTYTFLAYASNDIGASASTTSGGVFISGYGKRYWQAAVTGVAGTGSAVTYTAASHGFSVGDLVDIVGISPADYNLTQASITATTTDSFTVANTATDAFVSGGTVQGFALVTSGYRYDGTQWVPITTSQKVASGTTYSNFN